MSKRTILDYARRTAKDGADAAKDGQNAAKDGQNAAKDGANTPIGPESNEDSSEREASAEAVQVEGKREACNSGISSASNDELILAIMFAARLAAVWGKLDEVKATAPMLVGEARAAFDAFKKGLENGI